MRGYLYILFLFWFTLSTGQGNFQFPLGTVRDKIPVEIVNNLVIVPVKVNGYDIKFLLDSGADATIIFYIEEDESLAVNDVSYATVTGAGNGSPAKALKSNSNTIQIGKATSTDEPLLVLLDDSLDFSPQLGIAVQGIIGYQLFKDFIVEINYIKKYIKLHDPNAYTYKRCKDCQTFPLEITKNKAFINAQLDATAQKHDLRLLLDSGLGDALWLLQKQDWEIAIPEKQFEDFLGLGLNGPIYGKRAQSQYLTLGTWKLANVSTAFPDSLSTRNIGNIEKRHGSMGAEILKRFHTTIDYRNGKITLSKNKNYGSPFFYNKSGLTIQHGEFTLSREVVTSNDNISTQVDQYSNQVVELFRRTKRYKKILQPTYKIAEVRPNSPADRAGLQAGDYILAINNSRTLKMTLKQINEYFFQEDGKRITLIIERNGERQQLAFELESLL